MFPNGQDGPVADQNQPQQPPHAPQPGVPQQPSSPIFQIEPAAPSKKRGVLIGIIVGTVVLLIAVAAVLYALLVLNKAEDNEAPAPLADLNTVLLVSDLRKDLKKTYPQEVEAVAGKPVIAMEESADAPSYMPDGYQYGVQYESDTAFTFSLTKYVDPEGGAEVSTGEMKSLVEASVLSYFKKEQLTVTQLSETDTQKSTAANDDMLVNQTVRTLFTGRGVVCSFDSTVTASKEEGSVRCGEAAEFKRLAAEVQPFVESLTGIDRTMTLRDLKTADSPTGGYKQASLVIVDADTKTRTALFYKKDSGRWLSVGSSENGTLACVEFSTIEMQRAYLNSPCLDAQNKNATVQIIEKRR